MAGTEQRFLKQLHMLKLLTRASCLGYKVPALSMNRLRSAVVSKTSRSALQRSRLLWLAPLFPAHSRAPYANHAGKIGRGLPMDRNILIRTILPHPCPLPLGEGESSSGGLTRGTITSVQGSNARKSLGRILTPSLSPRRGGTCWTMFDIKQWIDTSGETVERSRSGAVCGADILSLLR